MRVGRLLHYPMELWNHGLRGRVACGSETEDGSRKDVDEAGGRETGSGSQNEARGDGDERRARRGSKEPRRLVEPIQIPRELSSVQVTPEYRPQGRGYVTFAYIRLHSFTFAYICLHSLTFAYICLHLLTYTYCLATLGSKNH